MVKILYWSEDGFAIWFKRLERGYFVIPNSAFYDNRIDRRELAMLLEGVVPKKVTRRYFFRK